MAREKNLESFFLDTENINHLNENYDEDAKSQKEYKDLHEKTEQESKENFYQVYYDTEHTNVANKIADKKSQHDGMEEEKIQQAKYEKGSYVQNNMQSDHVFTGLTSVNAFLAKYNPSENMLQAVKFVLNLELPENQLDKQTRAQILKEHLDFKDEEINTVQKFEDYRLAVDKKNIDKIDQSEFIQNNKSYFSVVAKKTGISKQNQNKLNNNFVRLLSGLKGNWSLSSVTTFYIGMLSVYNTQMFNLSQEMDVSEFNRQMLIMEFSISGRQNNVPNMQNNLTLNLNVDDINRNYNIR